jgi:hypothetical protein
MSDPYAYLKPDTEITPPKKKKTWIVILIIVIVIILIVIILIFLLTRGSSGSGSGGQTTTKCTSNSNCSAPNKICNTANGNCVECLVDGDCPTDFKCTGNKCCTNLPPTITTLSLDMHTPAQLMGSYTFLQSITNTTAVTQIYDSSGNILYTQAANNNLGIISVSESEVGSVIFANTEYQVGVSIKSDCGTSAFSTLVPVTGTSCLPTTPSIVSISGTVNTNQSPLGTPGINLTVTDTTGFFSVPFWSPKIGLLISTTPNKFPNEVEMLVQNISSVGFTISQFQTAWSGITPTVGTTYYARFFIETLTNIDPSNKCNSILSAEVSFVASN